MGKDNVKYLYFLFVSPVKYQPFAFGLFTLGRGQVPHAESFWPLPLPAVLCALGIIHTTAGFFSGSHCFVPYGAKGTHLQLCIQVVLKWIGSPKFHT